MIPSGPNAVWLVGGIVAAFAAVAIVVYLYLPRREEGPHALGEALGPYERVVPVSIGREGPVTRGMDLVRRIAALLPQPDVAGDSLDHRLDAAGWPLRAIEFRGIQAGGVLGGGLVGYGLSGSVVLAVVLAVAGAVAPRAVLDRQTSKRSDAFLTQLPDTLLLLAGALESGHSLQQGIEAIVHEAPAPTSSEFSRVLSEVRLGVPLAKAMDGLAERIGGEEFRFAVTAMNVQQEVGGNLAELLKIVAETLRGREQLQREVRVLSAEGRISGVILTLLPVALLLYIGVTNPSYLGRMTGSTAGIVLLLLAFSLIGVGALWIRRLVRVEV